MLTLLAINLQEIFQPLIFQIILMNLQLHQHSKQMPKGKSFQCFFSLIHLLTHTRVVYYNGESPSLSPVQDLHPFKLHWQELIIKVDISSL